MLKTKGKKKKPLRQHACFRSLHLKGIEFLLFLEASVLRQEILEDHLHNLAAEYAWVLPSLASAETAANCLLRKTFILSLLYL